MATVEDLKNKADLVAKATQVGENTAARVGGALQDTAALLADVQKKVDTFQVTQTTGDSESSVMSQKAVTEELKKAGGSIDLTSGTYDDILQAAAACKQKARIGAHIIYNDESEGLVEYVYTGSSTDNWSTDMGSWQCVGTGQDRLKNGMLFKHYALNSIDPKYYEIHYGSISQGPDGELIIKCIANATFATVVTIPQEITAGTWTVELTLQSDVEREISIGLGYKWGCVGGETFAVTTDKTSLKTTLNTTDTYSYIGIFSNAQTTASNITIYSFKIYEGKKNTDLWAHDDRLAKLEEKQDGAYWEDVTPKNIRIGSYNVNNWNRSIGMTLADLATSNQRSFLADVQPGEVYWLKGAIAGTECTPLAFLDSNDTLVSFYNYYTIRKADTSKENKGFVFTIPEGIVKMSISYVPDYGTAVLCKATSNRFSDIKKAKDEASHYLWIEPLPIIVNTVLGSYIQGVPNDTLSVASNNYYVSTGLIDCKEGDVFKVKLYQTDTYPLYMFFDKDNAVISGNCLYEFSYEAKGETSYEGYITAPRNAAKFVANSQKGRSIYVYKCHKDNLRVVTENAGGINRINAARDRFNTAANFKANGTGRNGSGLFTLAHISDLHTDGIRYKNFREFVDSLRIDAAINTGDIVNGYAVASPTDEKYIAQTATEMRYITDVDGSIDVLQVVGNHDKAGSNTYVNADDALYNNMKLSDMIDYTDDSNTEGKLYYVRKYSTTDNNYLTTEFGNSVWVIVLDQYDISDYADTPTATLAGKKHYSQAQITWLVGVLQSAIANNASVIIAMHHYDQGRLPQSNDSRFFQSPNYIDKSSYDTFVTSDKVDKHQATIVEDIVDAFKNGTSIKQNYTYSDLSTTIAVDVTFASAGSFICYLTGHTHRDLCGYSSLHPDQLYLTVACGCVYGEADGYMLNVGEQSTDLPRIIGTKSEDCFNVYAIDLQNKKVKVVRIGSDVTADMTDRKCAIFDIK